MKAVLLRGLLPALLMFARPPAAAAVALPPDFEIENVAPGAHFDQPTCLAFLPDGRLLVGQKDGRVWMVRDGAQQSTPVWDGRREVLANGDRGLTSIAVDPNFAANRRVYLAYVVDPDSNGTDDNKVAFSRVTRYALGSDGDVLDPSTRVVILGATWYDGIPDGSDSHTIDALRFAHDGSLLVSAGDGGLYSAPDSGGAYSALFRPGRSDPLEDIGSFRAQYLGSKGGKVLRIDPETGGGYPSNPYWNGDASSNRSKVWVYGLRNPWRFALRPGTGSADPAMGRPGTLYIANVGWGDWESIDAARVPGQNFGWPCYEGPEARPEFQTLDPARCGCGTIGTAENPAPVSGPLLTLNHEDPSLSRPAGQVAVVFTGILFASVPRYPASYRGKLYFTDYAQNWMKVASVTFDDHLASLQDFASDLEGPVDLATDPATGDLVYIAFRPGEVRRIRYAGAPPDTTGGAGVALSPPEPNPSAGPVDFTLDLPEAASVSAVLLDVGGREVWRAPARAYDSGRWTLHWSGITRAGVPARPGMYLMQVRAGGHAWSRRFVIVR